MGGFRVGRRVVLLSRSVAFAASTVAGPIADSVWATNADAFSWLHSS